MKRLYLLLLIISTISCTFSAKEKIVIGDFSSDISEAQVQIISSLTGRQKLQPVNYQLTSRTTTRERKLARKYLSNVIDQLSLSPIEQNYRQPNINPFIDILIGPLNGANIYAILPATKPTDQYVVLGAHYDTARDCPGANDNASAIALLYGVIDKLTRLEKRNLNVILVYFDQEEEELVGSKAFATYLKRNGFQIHSVHTFDQIGWDKDGDKAIELELPTNELERLYRNQAKKLNVPVYTTGVNSTDHQSFRDLGLNAVGITEEYVNGDSSPYKDTENDILETINFRYLESTTTLVFEVIKEIVVTE